MNFNLVTLQGGVRSTLDWSKERKKAQEYAENLLWEIDLGLNGRLLHPIGNEMQHQALGLALDHFRDTLWTEFCAISHGLILYRGSVDHAAHFHWDVQQEVNFAKWREGRRDPAVRLRQLYCGNVVVAYMQLLAQRLPDAMQIFAVLDCAGISDLLTLSQLVERYHPFHVTLTNSRFTAESKTAILLPPEQADAPGLREAMVQLQKENVPFRTIPEPFLLNEWDGLDTLYYAENLLTPQGKRMLQGFEAAGGTVVPK